MAVPSSDRKVIPPHFIAYLDKHRIYELFYDMASSLAMQMPADHILYLRNYLVDVASNRDKAKIMIIGPPFIDKKSVAKAVGHLLKIPVISLCDITNGDQKYYKNPDLLASKFKEFLYGHEIGDMGWILYVAERELWDEKYVGKPVKELTKYMKEYRRRLNGLRPALKNVLKEVPLHGRGLETIAKNLAILGRQSTHTGGPMLPRVVLIGTRGSFKRTIACSMAQQMGIVHINMDELIEQALMKENELSRELRELASRNIRLYGKLVIAVLEVCSIFNLELSFLKFSQGQTFLNQLVLVPIQDRLLDYDCLNKGWVLTGFPRDNKDIAILDLFDTPPNRVIFITNNSLEALERVTNRRINIYTGEYKHKDEVTEIEDVIAREQFVIHPDDELMRVMKEQKEFDDNIQGMLDYCKGNCIVVDGTGGLDSVMQRVFKATLQASPPGGLRTNNIDQILERPDDGEDEMKERAKTTKSILAMPGRSKSNVKVGFSPEGPPLGTPYKTETPPLQTISKNIEPKLKSTDTNDSGFTTDTTKPICLETSISGIKPIPKPPLALKKPEDLPQYESCTSVFPGEIHTEWGRVRNRIKSYTALPPLKTTKPTEK